MKCAARRGRSAVAIEGGMGCTTLQGCSRRALAKRPPKGWPLRCCKTRVSKEARTEETVAEASIGAAKEFEGIPGKPYRVDTGPNAAKANVRGTMAPLNHEITNTHIPTGNSPQTKYS